MPDPTGRPPLSSATVRLYIDGEQVDSERLRFPKVTEPLTACSIGAFGEFDAAAMAAAAAAAGGTVATAAVGPAGECSKHYSLAFNSTHEGGG